MEVNSSAAAASAILSANELRTTFLRQFLMGATAAALAGVLLVGLVWRSERLAHERSQFAASAAHELRTPLAGLRMYGEMLAEGLGDPARSSQYARRVADEAERLGRVVSNVLGFTRLEHGTLSLQMQRDDLGGAVLDCIQKQRPAIAAAGCELLVHVDENLPPVSFDRDAMFQVLHNLIDNAEKYSRGHDDRSIEVTLTAGSRRVVLTVVDHGPGIPASLARRLFRPFARGGSSDAPAGLGLGLALTRALVDAQGGTVEHAAGVTGGSVFRVSFRT